MREELLKYGFVYINGKYIYSFVNGGLCVCVAQNKDNFINNFSKQAVDDWQLVISGINTRDDCRIYKVRNIDQVKKIIHEFDPNDKKTNRFIAKYIILVILGILIALLMNFF